MQLHTGLKPSLKAVIALTKCLMITFESDSDSRGLQLMAARWLVSSLQQQGEKHSNFLS